MSASQTSTDSTRAPWSGIDFLPGVDVALRRAGSQRIGSPGLPGGWNRQVRPTSIPQTSSSTCCPKLLKRGRRAAPPARSGTHRPARDRLHVAVTETSRS